MLDENIRFGKFISIIKDSISESENLLFYKENKSSWFKQKRAMNDLLSFIADIEGINPVLKSLYENKNGVDYPLITQWVTGEKNIDRLTVESLVAVDSKKVIESFENSFRNRDDSFPKGIVVEKINNFINRSIMIEDDDYQFAKQLKKLNCYYSENKVDLYLATYFYYVLAIVPNKITKKQAKEAANYISSRMKKCIEENEFYDYHHRHHDIYICENSKRIRIIKTEEFKSYYLTPSRPSANDFTRKLSFLNEEERSNHEITAFIINGIDYANKLRIEPSEGEGRLRYKKEFILEDIPKAYRYDVKIVSESIEAFPIYEIKFTLLAPSRHLKVSATIRSFSESTNFSDKWRVSGSFFTAFIKDLEDRGLIRNIVETPHHYSVECFEWLPAGVGYYLRVRPKDKEWENIIGLTN